MLGILLLASTVQARTWVAGRDAPSITGCLQLAQPGDTVEVPSGEWRESLIIDKSITLSGKGGVVDGGGQGTVIRVSAAGARVENLTIQGSGVDLGGPDSCIYVEKSATKTQIEGNTLTRCGFGIWINEADSSVITANRIHGSLEGHRSNRGNSIHLFNGSHLVVQRNQIVGGRDGIYVSAVEDSLIEDNTFEQCRYGVHYMYSYRNTLRHNRGTRNFSGYALMGSRYIKAIGNLAAYNEQHGILLRDVEFCTVTDNQLVHNGIGFFIYSSTRNQLVRNTIAYNQVGIKLWAGSVRNEVQANAFVGNSTQIFYVSSADLEWGVETPGNFWSDYTGWDQDGDGVGDRPYRLDSFSTNLVNRFPAAVFLLRSPALELMSHLEQTMPVFRVPTVIDRRPLMVNPMPVPELAAPDAAVTRGAARDVGGSDPGEIH